MFVCLSVSLTSGPILPKRWHPHQWPSKSLLRPMTDVVNVSPDARADKRTYTLVASRFMHTDSLSMYRAVRVWACYVYVSVCIPHLWTDRTTPKVVVHLLAHQGLRQYILNTFPRKCLMQFQYFLPKVLQNMYNTQQENLT